MTGLEHENDSELAGLRAIWSDAERRLYPLATTVPDLYMDSVRMVRSIADNLASASDHSELLNHWSNRGDLLTEAQSNGGSNVPEGVPSEQILGSAFALRDRELIEENDAADRRARIEAARSQGDSWALLHERGDIDRGLADPYQCIEFHLPTGFAVVSTVEQEPSTAAPNHVVSVVQMDDDGRQVTSMDVPGHDDRETGDSKVFARNRTEVRAQIERATD